MSIAEPETKAGNIQKYWIKELELADKRVEKYLKKAKECVKLYEAQKNADNAFNILYSNTETLLPALYNALPRPIAQRRFKDADPVAKAVCDTLTRSLEYTIDSPDAKYESFNALMGAAVLGALVPGIGITWFRYDFESEDSGKDDSAAKGIAKEGTTYNEGDVTGTVSPDVSAERVVYEAVCAENVEYYNVRWGYANRWKNVPWVARKHVMSRVDVKRHFGPAVAAKVEYQEAVKNEDGDDSGVSQGNPNEDENRGPAKIADVWEIWHKSAKQVLFVSPQYKEGPLGDPKSDPLGLSGFFPCPEPLQFTAKVGTLVPVPLYQFYETQARELNKITLRIGRVINAIKVRGFYNGQLTELSTLLSQDDNTLLAAPNAAQFDGADLAKQIWLMPLQELTVVLQNLVMQRQQIKMTIYEITGISDILRGSTVASETATAQNIKSQWGTLRLKRLQKLVQEYVRASMRIMSEVIATKFSMETLAQITGLPYMQPQEKEQIGQQLQQLNQQAQMQPPPQPGQPPDPMQQQAQQLQAKMQQTDWGQVMQVLRNNMARGYKIDIETNSTIDADATEDRENINELMQALAGMMQSFVPAVQEGVLPMGAFKAIMMAISRRYEFGSEVEEELNGMPAQLPQKQDPAMQKVQAEMQLAEKEGQITLAVKQEEQKTKQMEQEMKRAELQQKAQFMQLDHKLKLEKMQADAQLDQATTQNKLLLMQAQAAMPKPAPTRQNAQAKARQ